MTAGGEGVNSESVTRFVFYEGTWRRSVSRETEYVEAETKNHATY